MPEFPGGKEGLRKFIQTHKIYPITVRNEGIHGRVLVKFIVDTDASIGNAEVLKGIGGGCDEEALRIINLMPKWAPGVLNNKNVKVKFTLQIEF